jgi:hypothetical protein
MPSITNSPIGVPGDIANAASATTTAGLPTHPPVPFAITDTNPFGDGRPNAYPSPSPATQSGSFAPSAADEAGQIYTTRLTQDSALSADGKSLADTVSPSNHGHVSDPAVRVSTFAVDGVQANDMMVIQRGRPELGKPNVVLYVPEKDGASFHEFNDLGEMNIWLKLQLGTPDGLDRFASHFANNVFPERREAAKNILAQFRSSDGNAVIGPYAEEHDDIFKRLDDGLHGKPPAGVNGLSNLGLRTESPQGERTYSGQRPDGETVIYKYDSYGNLHGAGDRGNYYFQKNALNNPYPPLTPLTKEQFGKEVARAANDNAGMNDLKGLYQEFIHHLENPAYGIGTALQQANVPASVANATERYLNNPIGSALVDINKTTQNWFGQQLGKLFGKNIDEADMNKLLDAFGGTAQYFVPYYGRVRFLAAISAKALKGETPTPDDMTNLSMMFKGVTDSLHKPNDQAQPAPGSSKHDKTAPPDKKSGTPEPDKESGTPEPDKESGPPEKLEDFATTLKPEDLAAMHKGLKDIYTDKDGKEYVLIDNKVYRAKLTGNPDKAHLLDPETGEYTGRWLDYSTNAWKIYDFPRGKGGNPAFMRYFSPKYREARKELEAVIHGPRTKKDLTEAQKKSFNDTLEKLIRNANAGDLEPAELRHAITDYVNKDVHGVRQYLLEHPGLSAEQLQSDPGVPVAVKQFLQAVDKLHEFKGSAYRNTRITPEGAERLRDGAGKTFIDFRVQSASIASFNAFGWEPWSKDNAMPRATQKTIFVFDESVKKLNMSNDQLPNHVVIPRNTWLKVLATKDEGDTLFVYLGAQPKTPDHAYNLHDGSQLL